MAELEITPTSLTVHIRGTDQIFALKTQLVVPLAHVSRVDVNAPEAHQIWHGLRIAGTNVPGIITAGRLVQQGEWAFWDVHDPDKAICIHLHDEHYAKLVIGVNDPEAAARELVATVQQSTKG